MDSSELITWLRQSAYIGDASAYPDQTDAVLRDELTHKLHSVFEDIVVKTRSGYWLKEYVTTTTSGRNRYRIPARAVVGGLEKVEVASSVGGVYSRLSEISPEDAEEWEGPITGGNPGTPEVFVSMGDQLEMFPAPNATLPLRLTYYVRPSQITVPQSGNNFVVRGLISAVNTTARTVVVNVLPFDQSSVVPGPLANGTPIDIVHPDGWHELAVVSAAATFAGTTFTLTGNDDMSDIQVGDYVRVANQSEWPCLPDDFHRALADVAAVKVAVELGLREKNDELAQNVENDLVRFRSLLVPRVKSEPKTTPVSLKSGRRW
jgi:hypothetical protein